MEKLQIEPVFASDLSQAAAFLLGQRATTAERPQDRRMRTGDAAGIERRLRWLLLDCPSARPAEPLGFCLRDGAQTIRGLNLCFPAVFVLGGKKVLGLGSGSFFVDAEARALGFYLFRKYLACPGYAFYFATTCNAASAPLWTQLGGIAVNRSEIEYIVPLRLDSILALRVSGRTANRIAAESARFAGRCADTLLALAMRPANLITVSPCRDWEKLAELSRRHRPDDVATSERSAELLQWRYGSASPASPCRVYLMRDGQGSEGWFALNETDARTRASMRSCALLDAIWPRGSMRLRDIVPAIMQTVANSVDAVVVRCRPDLDWGAGWRWFLRRRLAVPRSYVIVPGGARTTAADLLDYDDNDYVAWS